MSQQQKESIIYIYSDFSPCCKQVQERLVELSSALPIIILNIDNRRIRRILLRCKRIKIERVPALLIINNADKRVELYEGNNFLQAFDTLYNTFIVQPKIEQQQREQELLLQQQMQQQQMQQQQMQQQKMQQQQNLPDNIPQNMQYVPPNGKKATNKKTPLSAIISTEQVNNQPQEEEYKPPSKKKLGRTTFINDESLMPFSEDGIVAGSNVERPHRGEGHDGMAQSSLPEIGLTTDYTGSKKDVKAHQEPIMVDNRPVVEPDDEADEMVYDREIAPPSKNLKSKMSEQAESSMKKVPMKINGKMEMITDLTEALGDEGELFTSKEDVNIEEMRGGPPKNDVKTQKMSAAKMAAEQMMKERSAMA